MYAILDETITGNTHVCMRQLLKVRMKNCISSQCVTLLFLTFSLGHAFKDEGHHYHSWENHHSNEDQT